MSDGKKIAMFRQFQGELTQRQEKLFGLLPKHITPERFMYWAVTAVARVPKLLLCNRNSLHDAIVKAATDELLPDGREGVIVPRDEKGGVKLACWQPMVHGIRKRAAELGIIIDAKVIYANDTVEWEEGLNPILRVTPTALDQDPGDMIGAFAIFRRDGRVLHHEVMRRVDILKVKAVSKQPNGALWGKWEDQAWVKTVVRRGSKSVPSIPEKLQTVIERHDDDFDLNGGGGVSLPIDKPDATADPLADAAGTPQVDAQDGVDDDFSHLDDDFDTPLEAKASEGNVRPINRRRQA